MASRGRAGVLLLTIPALACAGRVPEGLGVREGRLAPCPSSPNCVSSDATDPGHAIAPIEPVGDLASTWSGLRALLRETPRVEIRVDEPDYLHAVFTTRIMRFRDDVEFHLRPAREEIAVRSASRLGHGDLGANRDRVERIRASLVERDLARPATGD